MSQIQVGVTTRQQVERLLGEPDGRRLTELGGGKLEWWSYSYATAAINPIDYLLLYGFLYNGIGLYDTRHDLHVFFDRHDRVSSWSRLKTDYEMGRPFGSGRIASVSTRMVGFPEAAKDPVLFEDRMEHRFE